MNDEKRSNLQTVMKYKISENLLKLREYGRNVQMMVEVAKTIKDNEERNALVGEIVRIMAAINPNVRDTPDYKQKLWDHLFLLADFDLDAESPFPIPGPEILDIKPVKRMGYQAGRSRFRSYGRNVDLILEAALKYKPGEERTELITMIANIMKVQIMSSTRDLNAENTVLEHLRVMTKGEVNLKPEEVRWYRTTPPPAQVIEPPRKRKKTKKRKRK